MGTRPEIIKMAPVYRVLREMPLEPLILHTGQHQDLAWPLYSFFEMEPHYCVSLDRQRPTLGHLSAILLDDIDAVFTKTDVDAVLVHGDTTSALMAALSAYYHQVPIGHVEAGLRSHSPYNPFPEEKNREMVARLATWHFAPTFQAMHNLISEGIVKDKIHHVGNTIVDAAQWGLENIESSWGRRLQSQAQLLPEVPLDARLMLVTAHRRENWGRPIRDIARGIRDAVMAHDDLFVFWPLHPNPRIKEAVEDELADLPASIADRLHLLAPFNYPQMLSVMQNAWVVLSDSGGVQEEAAALKVPVLVLRNTTERPELIENGGGVLVGTDPQRITAWVDQLVQDQATYRAMNCTQNPFGDGRAASYIAGILYHELVLSAPTQLKYAA